MTRIGNWHTGSQRGYVPVADRGVEGSITPVPETVKGLRGNERWALESLMDRGATHYTVTWYAGVRGKGNSNQYRYCVYAGYRAD